MSESPKPETPPSGAEAEAPPGRSAERTLPRRFSWILAGCIVAICAVSWLWLGIDFTVGVTLGCLIVGLNYVWTRSVVAKALQDGNFRSRIAISYLLKFALTVVVLFLAIVRFGVDPVAILVGVSTLLLAVIVLVASRAVF